MLEIKDLLVRYRTGSLLSRLKPGSVRSVDILAGVSLHVAPGKTLGLIGESGSGKTTLGRAVIGLTPDPAQHRPDLPGSDGGARSAHARGKTGD